MAVVSDDGDRPTWNAPPHTSRSFVEPNRPARKRLHARRVLTVQFMLYLLEVLDAMRITSSIDSMLSAGSNFFKILRRTCHLIASQLFTATLPRARRETQTDRLLWLLRIYLDISQAGARRD